MCSCKKLYLMAEIFKTIHNENPHFIRDIFVTEDTRYDLLSEFRLKVPCVNASTYGLHSVFQGQPTLEHAP